MFLIETALLVHENNVSCISGADKYMFFCGPMFVKQTMGNRPLCLSQFQLCTSPGQPPRISSKKLPGGRDLTFESCPGAGNSTRVGILWKVKVNIIFAVFILQTNYPSRPIMRRTFNATSIKTGRITN